MCASTAACRPVAAAAVPVARSGSTSRHWPSHSTSCCGCRSSRRRTLPTALQPYISGGLPLFITTVTPRTTSYLRNHDDDTDYSFGWKVAGGVAVHLLRNLMVFGEYRFTHVEAAADDLRSSDAAARRSSLKADLDTHTALIGLSARW